MKIKKLILHPRFYILIEQKMTLKKFQMLLDSKEK